MYKEHELRGAVPAPANSKGTEAMNRFQVRKVAVLGAGVMGAQIAAHLVNVKVPVVLFDLPAKEGPKNGIVTKAVEGLKKLKPSPLGVKDDAVLIQQANYEEHLEQLRGCDLIIEAIAERMDWKLDLYRKIAPFVAPHAIVASNTSGLSITRLSEALPAEMKPRFCGIHFFNPPRYMYLVELINTPTTDAHILDDLETFVTSGLGKGVVRAKDTPNFIANRVGIAGMLATMREVEKFGLSYDVVDDLTGKKMGRASSGTFRTADIVGLDTMAHVIKTLQDTLSPQTDPFYESFGTPAVLKALLEKGNLGQKTKAGFYKRAGRDVLQFELASGDYVPAGAKADEVYGANDEEAAGGTPRSAAQCTRRARAVPVGDPAQQLPLRGGAPGDDRRDRARRGLRAALGFRHEAGPVRAVAGGRLAAGGATGSRRTSMPARRYPRRRCPNGCSRARWRKPAACTRPKDRGTRPLANSSRAACCRCTRASISRKSVLGSDAPGFQTAGTTLHEDDSIRLWTLDDEVIIASLKTKMHSISPEVCEGLQTAIDLAEKQYQGLVIWSGDDPFSVGADLQGLMPAFIAVGVSAIDDAEQFMQQTMLRLRYANVPVIAAIRGMALGGGCELAVHAARRVAAMESYIGLVEVGVGLVPGGGGLAYIARRAAEAQARTTHKDLLHVPDRRLHRRGHGQGGYQRAGVAPARLPAGQRPRRSEQGRIAVRRPGRGQGHVHRRLPAAAQAPVRGGRSQRQGHDSGPAGQHARRRLRQPARFPHRVADRQCGDRRRRRRRHPGERGIPHGAGAPGLLRAGAAPQDPGADPGHVVDRQAGEKLARIPEPCGTDRGNCVSNFCSVLN